MKKHTKAKKFSILILTILIMSSCLTKKKKADLIVYNAKIYTLDSNFSIAESFAVKDGKILKTGTNEEISNKYEYRELLDANNKIIYPGFIDAHCHFYSYGKGLLRRADLKETGSFDEILEILKKHHRENPTEWIIGRGWDQNDWEIKEFPDNTELDRLFPDNPVALIRIDGHAMLANSEALKMANIGSKTKVDGGEIKLKNGNPTGILIDNAMDKIYSIIPELNENEKAIALSKAQENCFAAGLTSVIDAGLGKEIIETIDSLQKTGELKMRINAMISPTKENFEKYFHSKKYKTDRLNINAVKLYADGALGSRGALFIEDYSDDPGNSGLQIEDIEFYRDICNKAYKKGFQVNTHAIGDSAIRLMLNVYGESLKGKNDKRWRIEHSQVVHPDDFVLYKKYSIIPSIQSTHATSDMYWAEDRVGPERIKGGYAYKKLLDQNGWIPNGTDFPIENIYPLYSFYAAVVRKDLKGYPENGFQIENALSREEALKAMTIWAAKSCFEENEKGSLEAGKFADFVILEEDIMEIDEDKIPYVGILKTFINGEEVFSK
ncbi:MAG: amidohydrolase [Bacteroidales bacterium]|nr:amidohydrolase [Bacteroidales bacterium]